MQIQHRRFNIVLVALCLFCVPQIAFGLDSVELNWQIDYTRADWSKPGDGTTSTLTERSGIAPLLSVEGNSNTHKPYVMEHYVSVNGRIDHSYHNDYWESTNYHQDVSGALLASKGMFSTIVLHPEDSPIRLRVTLFSTWSSNAIKDVDLLYATPNSIVALRESNSNYFITNVDSWETLYSFDGSTWSESYDESKPLKGIAFTTIVYLNSGGGGYNHYVGVPQLPSLMIGDQAVPAIKQQTKDLSSTDGSSGVVSGVGDQYNKGAFDTRLGAVSQIADMSGQLFTAVLDGQEGNGIPFSGYSVTLPSGDVLSVPSKVVNIWSMFPEAETPVRTICTAMLVLAFVRGMHHLYDRFLGNEIEVSNAGGEE